MLDVYVPNMIKGIVFQLLLQIKYTISLNKFTLTVVLNTRIKW